MRVCRAAAVAVLLLGVFIGCGTEKVPPGEGGGSGGAAGAGGDGGGGSGGSAGMGGTGGSEPRCGDGQIDAGEACDDGNDVSGDGCSFRCEWEGSCDAPIDFGRVSAPDPEFPTFFSTGVLSARDLGVPGGGRCGGGGAKRVLRYVAPATGRLVHVFEARGTGADDARSYVRRSCIDPSSEVWRSCQKSTTTGLVQMDAVEGEVFYFVADFPGAGEDGEFLMGAEIFPFREEGESCGMASGLDRDHMWQCAPGYTCRDIGSPDVCAPNEAPSIASIRALRGGDSGNDLVAIFELEDPNADYWYVDTWAFDRDDEPILTTPNPGAYDADPNQVPVIMDRSIPFTPVLRSFGASPGLFGRFPEIARLDFRVRDLGSLTSNVVTAEVEPQPLAGPGDACDPYRALDRCESDDLVCRGPNRDESVCESRAADRIAACAAASTVEVSVGARLELTWNKDEFTRLADWPIPWDCFGQVYLADNRLLRPERLFRLHLDDARTNVSIRTGDRLDSALTAIALFDGCGLQGQPLACNHTSAESASVSRIDLPSLEAGDYLLVVSLPKDRGAGQFKVIVEADPLPNP